MRNTHAADDDDENDTVDPRVVGGRSGDCRGVSLIIQNEVDLRVYGGRDKDDFLGDVGERNDTVRVSLVREREGLLSYGRIRRSLFCIFMNSGPL